MYPYPAYSQYGMNAQQRMEQMQAQYPQFGQQPMSPTPAAVSPQNVNWIYVTGAQDARDHIVQPNQTAWMMDNNEQKFYLKNADALGTTSFKAYRFEEITDGQTAAPQIDPTMYVSRAEFDELKAQIEKLSPNSKAKASKEAQS
jgi:hypothetical protein